MIIPFSTIPLTAISPLVLGPVGGDLSSWKAYNRPYIKFDLNALWEGK